MMTDDERDTFLAESHIAVLSVAPRAVLDDFLGREVEDLQCRKRRTGSAGATG
jgi:hypothetical protein